MRTGLNILVGLIVVLTLAVWLGTGAHWGWTQTRVTVMRVDPITELEYPETRDQFVAGFEVLAAGFATALGLLAVSLFLKKPTTTERKVNQP